MLFDPNVAYLGGEGVNDQARIVFVDGNLTNDDHTDDVNPLDLEWKWSLSGLDTFAIRDEQRGQDAMTISDSVSFGVEVDTPVGVRNLRVLGDTVRFTDFSGSIGFTAGGSDQIVDFDRHGDSDYSLFVHESGGRMRVFTESDNGTFDAATLDGVSRSGFTEPGDDESITGQWSFENGLSGGLDVGGPLTAGNVTAGNVTAGDVDADSLTSPSATIGGSAVVTEAVEYFPSASDGTTSASDVGEFSFGNDLGIETTASGVQVNYTGAEIPSIVQKDGTNVLENADGINFVGDTLSVSATGDGIPDISVVIPDAIAAVDADETVTGTWSFNNHITGSIDEADHAAQADSATSAGTAQNANQADLAADAERLGGAALGDIAEIAGSESITGQWYFDTGPTIPTATELGFGDAGEISVYRSSNTGRLIFADNSENSATIGILGADGAEFPQGAQVAGSDVLTRSDEGGLEVAHANNADDATHATNADNATNADHAAAAPDASGFTITTNSDGRASLKFDEPGSGEIYLTGLLDAEGASELGNSRSIAIFAGSADTTPNVEFTQSGQAYFGGHVQIENEVTFRNASGSADGVHFPNGVTFGQYQGQATAYVDTDNGSDSFRVYDNGNNQSIFEATAGGIHAHEDVIMNNWLRWDDFQIRPSDNEVDGLSVRASSNPNTGDPIFTVESSGSATRFLVRHGGSVEIPNDGLYVDGTIEGGGNLSTNRITAGDIMADDINVTSALIGGAQAVTGDKDWHIEKNGSDSNGVINFTT